MDTNHKIFNDVLEDKKIFYEFLTKINLNEVETKFLYEKLKEKFQSGTIKKHLTYLSLLTNQSDLLKNFISIESKEPLDFRDSTSLFIKTHHNKTHWITDLIRGEDHKNILSSIWNELRILKLIYYSNQRDISEEDVDGINGDDEFVNAILNEIIHNLKNLKFFKEKYDSIDSKELFNHLSHNTLLETFYKYFKLDETNEIKERLEEEEDYIATFGCNNEYDKYSDSEIFKAFMVIQKTLLFLTSPHEINEINEAIRCIIEVWHTIDKLNLQIDVLEDLFALCFCNIQNPESQWTYETIRFLLLLLKTCLEYLYAKKFSVAPHEDNRRLNLLNKYVVDASWRLELISQLKSSQRVIHYMLSTPETLITMCLKRKEFYKAEQVTHIFNMLDSELAMEIKRSIRNRELRRNLQTALKKREIQTGNTIPNLKVEDENINSDLLLTFSMNYENYKEIYDGIEKKFPNEHFKQAILTLNNEICEVKKLPLVDVLNNEKYAFNLKNYKDYMMFYENLLILTDSFEKELNRKNDKYIVTKKFKKIIDLMKKSNKYLRRIFNYLNLLSSMRLVVGNNSDRNNRSCFDLLRCTVVDMLSGLILQEKSDPQDFEILFGKLRLDLLYVVSSIFFPKINLRTLEVMYTTEKPGRNIVNFVKNRNWLLSYILCRIFDLKDFDFNDNRVKYLKNYLNLKEIENLKILFNNNEVLTILSNDYVKRCLHYLDLKEKEEEINDFESAEELFEDTITSDDNSLLILLDSIPESQTRNNEKFSKWKDRILNNLLQDEKKVLQNRHVESIKSDSIRQSFILNNLHLWPGEFCATVLRTELSRGKRVEFGKWLDIIEFSEQVKPLLNYDSWHECYSKCLEDPEFIIQELMKFPKANLLLKFLELFDITLKNLSIEYAELLFFEHEPLNDIQKLFNSGLPEDILINLCLELMEILKNLEQLQFLLDRLRNTSFENEELLNNIDISLKICRNFNLKEQEHLLNLIRDPICIIETLLMNTKLDKLGWIIKNVALDSKLHNAIFIEKVDEILRNYAEKSLEVRVVLTPHPKLLKDNESKLMQSLDSVYGPDRNLFVMPINVPSKSEWIPNNEVLECMCCQNTIFSMFNRRHHCRRCGRVICFNCSSRRMIVDTYGDVLVRVCKDCYDQSHMGSNSSFTDSNSTKSILYDYYILTNDQEHNEIVRQEFSYEHAPSVSLCLSIMKLHTKTAYYPQFLLEQCNNLLKLIQPLTPNLPLEIDFMLVIRMLKSLAIAAKMLSTECNIQSGVLQADRLLSQADLLGLLVERACLHLLPASCYNNGVHIDTTVLRRVRDKLLETEQWNFALDISTKAGLDSTNVFVAWGKNYLKAGSFKLAREKFSRCFEKSTPFDYMDHSFSGDLDETSSVSYKKRYSSKISLTSETKPKNFLLLTQIIQILESKISIGKNSFKTNLNEIMKYSGCDDNKSGNLETSALIKQKLNALKNISAGNYPETDFKNKIDSIYFKECLYYLCKYGNHLSILQFYLRHGFLNESLHYIVDNNVSTDVFVEVYMISLKNGEINDLQEKLIEIDPTLDVWKNYLGQICRYLEKQKLLNSLYQLQLFMGDFVRAAMTCICFYKENAASFKELKSNENFLQQAELHLKQELEQQQWVEVNAVEDLSNGSKGGFEEKSLSKPSLVMKMSSKNVERHIKTINLQLKITNFIASHEKENGSALDFLLENVSTSDDECKFIEMPTLFDSQDKKVQLTVIILICSEDILEGFNLANQIIQDCKLKPTKIYCHAGRILAEKESYNQIAQLVSYIKSSETNDTSITDICDEMLALSVRTLYTNNATTSQLEMLIKLISDKAIKISMYIETKHLKSAYLLAAKYNRYGDVRRILREADLLNKYDIKKLCQKLLQAHSHSHKE